MDMDIRAEDNSNTNDVNDGWQPARIAPVSNRHKYHPLASTNKTVWDTSQGQVVRVRVVDKGDYPNSIRQIGAMGCESDHFYEIHPDDWERLYGDRPLGPKIMCEHAIQVD